MYKKIEKLCIYKQIDLCFYILPNAFTLNSSVSNYFKFENDTKKFLKHNFPFKEVVDLTHANLTFSDFSDYGHLNRNGALKLFPVFDTLDHDLMGTQIISYH